MASESADRPTSRPHPKYDFAALGVGERILVSPGKLNSARVMASGFKAAHPGWDYKTGHGALRDFVERTK